VNIIEDQKTNVGRPTNRRPVNRSFRFALLDIIYLSPNSRGGAVTATNVQISSQSLRAIDVGNDSLLTRCLGDHKGYQDDVAIDTGNY
jgi:hypothetical protein